MNRIADTYVEVMVDGVLRRRGYTVGSDSRGRVQINPEITRGLEQVVRHEDGSFTIVTVNSFQAEGVANEEAVD